jgi:phosphohistidine swiveling domain-containing protein
MIAILKTLDEVVASDRERIGGKAFNCGRLRQAGFPVPEGIVIPADLPEASIRDLAADQWFARFSPDTLFAVRSSGVGEDGAEHSFAGIHETQLNVPRAQVVEAVLVCRRSAGSAQAKAYRDTVGIGENGAAIGVLVQCMVAARVSGVAFTVNPVTGADELVIDAAPGLGDALVSGQIEPDQFIVEKRSLSARDVHLGAASKSPALVESQLAELASMLVRIEQHCGAPQDVEFCHDGKQFWIVQSRPITTARSITHPESRTEHPEPRSPHPGPRTEHPEPGARNPETEWTRANLAEVLPEQMSQQALAAYEHALNRGQELFMGRLLAPELGPMFKAFHGRMYMNLSQMRRVMRLSGAPAADMLRSLGHPEQIGRADEVAVRAPIREILAVVPDILRVAFMDARAEALLHAHQSETDAILARLREVDPDSLSDRGIWQMLEWWLEAVPAAIQIVFVMSGVQVRETRLRKIARRVGVTYEQLVLPQLAAGPRSVSSQQAVDLVHLGAVARGDARVREYLLADDGAFSDFRRALAGTAFLEQFDRFLDRYGHRGRYESDWALPRLHEDPVPALFAIREQLQGPPQDIEALTARQEAAAREAWREFDARLSGWQRLTLRPRARSLLRRLKKQYVWREQVRSDLTRILRYVRPYHLALARRFVERGWIEQRDDYFLLRLDEVGGAIAAPERGRELRAIVEERKAVMAAEREMTLPLLMRESELARRLQERSAPAPAAAELEGLCVSPGVVEADVIVLRDPKEFASMRRGAILVTRATDPSWTPLFTLASGVVVEVGGMLSHASTIAREYGLPALANVKDAMRHLNTGDRVRLEASGGRLVVLARSPDSRPLR